jgi:2-oxoglutarate ferredoxin oxidoreductase subunit delta
MRLHNPIARHTKTVFIHLNTSLCQACWSCVEACPNKVIGKTKLFSHIHAHIDYAERCEGCGTCASVCPNQAIIYTYHKN